MKKIACLILLLSAIAFAQEPQWTVVSNVVVYNQTQGVGQTTLFTPSETGLYRVSFYMSAPPYAGPLVGGVIAFYDGTDVSGVIIGEAITTPCRGTPSQQSTIPTTYALAAGQPFTYTVVGGGCPYNLAIVVEQLVQGNQVAFAKAP